MKMKETLAMTASAVPVDAQETLAARAIQVTKIYG